MIQVFSNRKDKKHQYRFTDLSEGTDVNGIGLTQLRLQYREMVLNGKAFMTRLILKMFMLLIRLMLLKQSQQMIIKKLELMTVRV